jgi:hypothetical protein
MESVRHSRTRSPTPTLQTVAAVLAAAELVSARFGGYAVTVSDNT